MHIIVYPAAVVHMMINTVQGIFRYVYLPNSVICMLFSPTEMGSFADCILVLLVCAKTVQQLILDTTSHQYASMEVPLRVCLAQ